MKKIRCALIGSGNIGTDLIYKIQRSPWLEPVWMVGIDPESEGLARARDMGLKTTSLGVDGLLPHVLEDNIQIAFDATSAYVHAENSRKLNELGVMMIDLTPAHPPGTRPTITSSTPRMTGVPGCIGTSTLYSSGFATMPWMKQSRVIIPTRDPSSILPKQGSSGPMLILTW